MKKVAIDCRLIGKEISGIAKYLLMILKGLQQKKDHSFEICLIASSEGHERSQITVLLGDVPFNIITVKTKPFTVKEQFLLPDVLKNNKIDIFYSPYFCIPFVCDAKTITTFHDLIPILYPQYVSGTKKGKYNKLFRLANYLAVKRSAHIVVVSETTRNDFFKHYGLEYDSKVSVVYEGVETFPVRDVAVSKKVHVFSEKKPFILYVGRQDPYKNISNLLRAFQKVREKIYGVNLVIAGKKDPRFFPGLFEEARRLKLSNSISFTGYVNEAELELLYSHASALVNPSLYEGFGLTPLEGFLRGCPAIVSKIPINEEILDTSALYINPSDPGDIAEKITVFLKNEVERNSYIQRGKERIQGFTCIKAAEHLLEVFEKCMR